MSIKAITISIEFEYLNIFYIQNIWKLSVTLISSSQPISDYIPHQCFKKPKPEFKQIDCNYSIKNKEIQKVLETAQWNPIDDTSPVLLPESTLF